MDWLPYYIMPAVVIIIVWLSQRAFRKKKSINQTFEQPDENFISIENNESLEPETEIVNGNVSLDTSKNEEDYKNTSSSEYLDFTMNISRSLICRHECTENEIQNTNLTSSNNEETDLSSIFNTSTSEHIIDSLSTLPSTIYAYDSSTNEIEDYVRLAPNIYEEAEYTSNNTTTYEYINSVSDSPSTISSNDYSTKSVPNMNLIHGRNKQVYNHSKSTSTSWSEITETSASDNIGTSSSDNIETFSTLPSDLESNDSLENDIKYVEDFSDVGLYTVSSDESDIDDNMNKAFIEINEIM